MHKRKAVFSIFFLFTIAAFGSGCTMLSSSKTSQEKAMGTQAMEQRQAKAQISHEQKQKAFPNYLGLAQPLVANGYYDIALTQLEEAEKAGDINPEIVYLKGVCLRQTKQFDLAEKAFMKTLEIMPDHAAAHNGLAVLYDQTKRHEEALASYDRAIHLNPANASFYNCKGYSLLMAGDCKNGAQVLKTGLTINPDSKKILNNLGIAFALCQDWDRALTVFIKAGGEAAAYNNMGFVHEIQGDYGPAMAMYQKALNINPKHSQARKNMKRVRPFCSLDREAGNEQELVF